MNLPANERVVIRTRQQWDAICLPTRAAIIEQLNLGVQSVREIAEGSGFSTELVHHHMGVLLAAGIAVEHQARKLTRHTERLFALPPGGWAFDPESDPELFAEGIMRMARSWGNFAERTLGKAMEGGKGVDAKFLRHFTLRSETAKLTPAAAQQVAQHLAAIKSIFQEQRANDDGERYMTHWTFFPIGSNSQSLQKK